MKKIKTACLTLIAMSLVSCGKVSDREINKSIIDIKHKYEDNIKEKTTDVTNTLESSSSIEESTQQGSEVIIDKSIEENTTSEEETTKKEVYSKEEMISFIEEHKEDWYWSLKGIHFFEVPDERTLVDIYETLKPIIASGETINYLSMAVEVEEAVGKRVAEGGYRNNDVIISGNKEEPAPGETFAELNVWINDPNNSLSVNHMPYDEYVALYGEPNEKDVFPDPKVNGDWKDMLYSEIELTDITYTDKEVIFTISDRENDYKWVAEVNENYRLKMVQMPDQ